MKLQTNSIKRNTFQLYTINSRKDSGTHLSVSSRFPLGDMLNFTYGPPSVDLTGIDEFSFLSMKMYTDNAKNTKRHTQNF